MKSFKESMSKVANTVSVLALSSKISQDGLIAVTISSIVSTSVEENQEEVLFILKSDSYASKYLEIGTQFSINVLKSSQKDLAIFYGKSADKTEKSRSVNTLLWNYKGTIPTLRDAHIVLECDVTDRLSRRNSTLFFAKVMESSHSSPSDPLLHFNRSYYNMGSEN